MESVIQRHKKVHKDIKITFRVELKNAAMLQCFIMSDLEVESEELRQKLRKLLIAIIANVRWNERGKI